MNLSIDSKNINDSFERIAEELLNFWNMALRQKYGRESF